MLINVNVSIGLIRPDRTRIGRYVWRKCLAECFCRMKFGSLFSFKMNYGSSVWPIDLTCEEDFKMINLVPEEEVVVVKVVPGVVRNDLVRGVIPPEELEWLKGLGREARKMLFECGKKDCLVCEVFGL